MKQLTDNITFRHGATINNRLVQAPMLTNSGDNEAVSQDTLDYYGARSQSAGMVIVEYTSVRKNGGPSRSWADNREQLAIYDDRFKPGMTKVAKALKKDGNKAILQLVHSGREANYAPKLGRTVEVPSQMDFPWIDYPLHELTSEEVEQVVKDFGAATKRAIDCGFDGVEIHGANHYLIQQFFSAFSNHRTDKWGGSLEKRMNFPLIHFYGLNGAMWSTVLSEIGVTMYQLIAVRGLLSYRILFSGLWKYIISGVVMFLPVFWMNTHLQDSWLMMGLEVIVGVVIYVAMVIVLRVPIVNETRNLIINRLQSKKTH